MLKLENKLFDEKKKKKDLLVTVGFKSVMTVMINRPHFVACITFYW